MKFGIISFAHMHAYSYARALGEIAGVALVGVADPDPERGQAAAEQFKAPRITATTRSFWRKISTP